MKLSKIWTFAKALDHLVMRLKEYTDENIGPQGWADLLNLKLMQAQGLLNLKNSVEYKEPLVVVPTADTPGGWWNSVTVDFNATTKVLTIPNGIFGSSFSPDFTNFNAVNVLGARVFFAPDLSAAGIFEAYIVRVIDNNNVELNSNANIGGLDSNVGGLVTPGNSDSVNIGNYGIYKNIREIAQIESNVYGECIKKTKGEFLNITKPPIGSYHSHWTKRIIWTRDGELLKFGKGELSSYGTLTVWIFRTPYEVDISKPNEYLDARDDDMNIIFDMCLLAGLETLKIPIPQNLKSSEAQINQLIAANEKQKAKLLTGKDE